MKINKINPKTFENEVITYHNKILYINKGKGIRMAASKVLAVPKYEYYKYYLYLVSIQTLKILDFLFISSISGFE
jgi:hypothetical protein